MQKNFTGEVKNPLMHGGPVNWEAVKTKEFPRKCEQCHWVYPSDHANAPKPGGKYCLQCGKLNVDVLLQKNIKAKK